MIVTKFDWNPMKYVEEETNCQKEEEEETKKKQQLDRTAGIAGVACR